MGGQAPLGYASKSSIELDHDVFSSSFVSFIIILNMVDDRLWQI